MSNFLDRLTAEIADLEDRLTKLTAFLSKGKPTEVNSVQWTLLQKQEVIMTELLSVLKLRKENILDTQVVEEESTTVNKAAASANKPFTETEHFQAQQVVQQTYLQVDSISSNRSHADSCGSSSSSSDSSSSSCD